MRVQLVGYTQLVPPVFGAGDWTPEEGVSDGESLIEMAGRACYQSWNRPNQKTAKNADYIAHVLDVGHYSVLEHGTATFYVTGVSRSLTHELVRHRHLSPSQLSQRFVDEGEAEFVVPPLITDVPDALAIWQDAMAYAQNAYRELIDVLDSHMAQDDTVSKLARRKKVRESARSVLPNSTETKIVLTGNYRAWRHFIYMRATSAADAEIRALAVEIYTLLANHAPSVFSDSSLVTGDDGVSIVKFASADVS